MFNSLQKPTYNSMHSAALTMYLPNTSTLLRLAKVENEIETKSN